MLMYNHLFLIPNVSGKAIVSLYDRFVSFFFKIGKLNLFFCSEAIARQPTSGKLDPPNVLDIDRSFFPSQTFFYYLDIFTVAT